MDRILGVQLGSRQALDDEADEDSEDPAAEQGKPNSYLNQGRDDSMVLDDAAGTIQIPPCSPRSDCIDKLDTAQTSQAAITGEKTSTTMELDSSLHEVVTTIAASTEEQLDEVVALDDVKSATAAVSVAAKSAIDPINLPTPEEASWVEEASWEAAAMGSALTLALQAHWYVTVRLSQNTAPNPSLYCLLGTISRCRAAATRPVSAMSCRGFFRTSC